MDPVAMEANAHLADQVHEYEQRYLAELALRKRGEGEVAARASAPPEGLGVRRDEYARLAREGTLRVRVPCARWDAAGRVESRGPHGGVFTSAGRRFDAQGRAKLAGLSDQEIDALSQVYERATQRLWESMRATCEQSQAYRDALEEAESDEDDDEDPMRKIRSCAAQVVRPHEEATQSALVRVGEARAAGGSASSLSGDEAHVLFALTGGTDVLVDELVRTFGREKASRVVDYGVACVDETTYRAQ